ISSSAASENKIFAEFIYHSGKPRAMETAEIVADVIEFQGEIEKATDLRPLDDPEIWAEKLKTIDQNIMLVGHMPFMSKMAALLITGSENKEVLDFTTGSIACLNRDDTGLWTLEWASF
ncbi:MAG: hypothetical protein GY863_13430, partial [bacterium]|nr:hypothetical protein [bacterium]